MVREDVTKSEMVCNKKAKKKQKFYFLREWRQKLRCGQRNELMQDFISLFNFHSFPITNNYVDLFLYSLLENGMALVFCLCSIKGGVLGGVRALSFILTKIRCPGALNLVIGTVFRALITTATVEYMMLSDEGPSGTKPSSSPSPGSSLVESSSFETERMESLSTLEM